MLYIHILDVYVVQTVLPQQKNNSTKSLKGQYCHDVLVHDDVCKLLTAAVRFMLLWECCRIALRCCAVIF